MLKAAPWQAAAAVDVELEAAWGCRIAADQRLSVASLGQERWVRCAGAVPIAGWCAKLWQPVLLVLLLLSVLLVLLM